MLHEKDNEILRLVQENNKALQQKENKIQEQHRLLQQKERQLLEERASQERQLHEERQHQEEIASRGRQLRRLNQQLEEQEQVTAEIQQTNHSLQRQVEQLQQQLSQQSLKLLQPPHPSQAQVRRRQLQEREALKQSPVQPPLKVDHKPHPHKDRKIILNWRDGGKAPFKIQRGDAVVVGNMAYFMNYYGEMYSYSLSSKKWSELPKCPYQQGSLAVISGQLVAIGGCKDVLYEDTYTNKLLSLPIYKEIFPPMPTKRKRTTVITSKEHLIVAGGTTGPRDSDIITTVEVMNTKTLVWSLVASLTHIYINASGTICGDQLYMLGGSDDTVGMTKSVLTCSLTELLQSSSSSSSIWHRVADVPAYNSTCAAVNGELLAVGGCDGSFKSTSAIHKYNPTTNSWDRISNMPTARYLSLVVVLPTNETMVVSGKISSFTVTDQVEVAHLNLCPKQ